MSPSTQNLALSAILFLYQKVLEIDLPWLDDLVRAKPKRRVPVVLSTREIQRLFLHCRPSQVLPVQMLYGSGLRLMECLRLRVGDLDFSRHTVRVHAGNYWRFFYCACLLLAVSRHRSCLNLYLMNVCFSPVISTEEQTSARCIYKKIKATANGQLAALPCVPRRDQ